MWHRCPYRLRTGKAQKELLNPRGVDPIKALMLAGQWDYAATGWNFIYWRRGRTVWISNGHHRVDAALEVGRETGDWSYLDRLLASNRPQEGEPFSRDQGMFPARRLLNRWLTYLGW
jgi:hypothetical protein